MKFIDLNCDMGEGMANDAELMDFVSSVNIACGYHAGDRDTMKRTVELALEKGLAIGAHPGYADRANFGRTNINLPMEGVHRLVVAQVTALRDVCYSAGATLAHVKPHGALYNQAATDEGLAQAIAAAVKSVDAELILYGPSGSVMVTSAERLGLATASEAFADRTYQNDGTLTPRTQPNALIDEPSAAINQVLQMVQHGTVTSVDGRLVPLAVETICIHGDGRNAVAFARAIREALEQNGREINPP